MTPQTVSALLSATYPALPYMKTYRLCHPGCHHHRSPQAPQPPVSFPVMFCSVAAPHPILPSALIPLPPTSCLHTIMVRSMDAVSSAAADRGRGRSPRPAAPPAAWPSAPAPSPCSGSHCTLCTQSSWPISSASHVARYLRGVQDGGLLDKRKTPRWGCLCVGCGNRAPGGQGVQHAPCKTATPQKRRIRDMLQLAASQEAPHLVLSVSTCGLGAKLWMKVARGSEPAAAAPPPLPLPLPPADAGPFSGSGCSRHTRPYLR